MIMRMVRVVMLIIAFWAITPSYAAAPIAPVVPAGAEASNHFNVQVATDAWLAKVAGPDRQKSDAYFEGGYWLIFWDFLATVGGMLLLLETRASAWMRNAAERATRVRILQYWIYYVELALVMAILTFPLTVYEGWIREHQYDLSNQSFGAWFTEQLIGMALSLLFGGLVFSVLIAIARRLPRTWPVWSASATLLFVTVGTIMFPMFVAPLFNKYKPLENQLVKSQILSMARANDIPARDVYEVDASRQSKRVSANVSGLFGTTRITLNDNLLNRCAPQTILATVGHEMGHYVLHHTLTALLFAAIVIFVLFAGLRFGLDQMVARFGARWSLMSPLDLAAVPVAVLLLSTFGFLLTPIQNSFTRMQEYEADIFGLNASRQPDGEAEVDLLLGEYRKLDPSPMEEMIFFDHPSGRTRITEAMRWKGENLCLFDARLPCGGLLGAGSAEKKDSR